MSQENTEDRVTLELNKFRNFAEIYVDLTIAELKYRNKLQLKTDELKCIYVPHNKTEALNLQTEINCINSFLDRVTKIRCDLAHSLITIARTLNYSDGQVFTMLYLQGKDVPTIAKTLSLSEKTIRNKKVKFDALVKSLIEGEKNNQFSIE